MAKSIISKGLYRLSETINLLKHGIRRRPDYRKSTDMFEGEQEKRIKLLAQKKTIWPKGCIAAFNLQFDDFCAKEELGGLPNKGVNELFFNAIKRFPFVKTTMFTIPDPKFDDDSRDYSINTNKQWLRWIRSRKFSKIEIANHGLNHLQHDLKDVYPAGEFLAKDLSNATQTLLKANGLFKKSGINTSGTRPPAYELGKNLEFIEAAKLAGFGYVAASTPLYGLNLFKKRVSNIYPEFYDGILNLPANISIHQSLAEAKPIIDRIMQMNGLITLRGHYVLGTDRLSNGIDQNTMKNMTDIIDYIITNYKGRIWFATLDEIARWWIAKFGRVLK